jgi:hypothetical protein
MEVAPRRLWLSVAPSRSCSARHEPALPAWRARSSCGANANAIRRLSSRRRRRPTQRIGSIGVMALGEGNLTRGRYQKTRETLSAPIATHAKRERERERDGKNMVSPFEGLSWQKAHDLFADDSISRSTTEDMSSLVPRQGPAVIEKFVRPLGSKFGSMINNQVTECLLADRMLCEPRLIEGVFHIRNESRTTSKT